jgi:hypothetical protein
VRPKFAGNYRIKFKAEALPLRDQVGGYRLLYSHNAQFPLSQAPEGDRESMGTLARVFPALEALKTSDTDKVELVNQTIVEEVLQDLGVLNFGKGITADSNIGIWRERGTHYPLCGEFAFQAKFKRRDDVHDKVISRCEQFFIALQQSGRDWLFLPRSRASSWIKLTSTSTGGLMVGQPRLWRARATITPFPKTRRSIWSPQNGSIGTKASRRRRTCRIHLVPSS